MKVNELKKILNKFDENLVVVIQNDTTGGYEAIQTVSEVSLMQHYDDEFMYIGDYQPWIAKITHEKPFSSILIK